MLKQTVLLGSIIVCLIISSCSSTKIISSWSEPNKTIALNKLKKVLVVALFKSEDSRHNAEDQMVVYLKGTGVVSYKYLEPNFRHQNVVTSSDKIKADGFDGTITMRLLDVEKEKIFVSRHFYDGRGDYPNFGNYYERNYFFNASPDYYDTTKTFTIETVVFSIKENRIIWTAITKTVDPDGISAMTAEISKIIYNKMLSDGFITKN